MRAQVADIFTMDSLVAFDMAGNQIAEVVLVRQLASAWRSSGLVIDPVIMMVLIGGVAMEMAHTRVISRMGLFFSWAAARFVEVGAVMVTARRWLHAVWRHSCSS